MKYVLAKYTRKNKMNLIKQKKPGTHRTSNNSSKRDLIINSTTDCIEKNAQIKMK